MFYSIISTDRPKEFRVVEFVLCDGGCINKLDLPVAVVVIIVPGLDLDSCTQ